MSPEELRAENARLRRVVALLAPHAAAWMLRCGADTLDTCSALAHGVAAEFAADPSRWADDAARGAALAARLSADPAPITPAKEPR